MRPIFVILALMVSACAMPIEPKVAVDAPIVQEESGGDLAPAIAAPVEFAPMMMPIMEAPCDPAMQDGIGGTGCKVLN